MKSLKELIYERAKIKKQKIGIVLRSENLLDSETWFPSAKAIAEVIATDEPDYLIDLLIKGEIKGIVRGQSENQYDFVERLGKIFNFEEDYRCSIIRDVCGRYFFFGPTGLNGVNNYQGRKNYILRAIEHIKKFHLDNLKIALLSPIWKNDVEILISKKSISEYDRKFLEQLMEDEKENRLLISELKELGLNCFDYGNRIEKALWDGCNFIVPINGVAGNAISRALWLIDNRNLSTDPNKPELISLQLLTEKHFDWVFENTSSSERDFSNHIIAANAWLNSNESRSTKE